MALYSLVPYFWQQFFDDNGDPLAGGKVSTFLAGTATPVFTFSDSAGSLNTNPIILSASGRARIYVDPLLSYKFTATDANNVPVGLDMDPVSWNLADIASNSFKASVLGSAAAPAYSFVADPDTGMYAPFANVLAFATGAAERMRITSNGGVAIGNTNNPAAGNLDLAGGIVVAGAGVATAVSVAGNTGLTSAALGAGAITGRELSIGRNVSGSGAAGFVTFIGGGGASSQVWVDASAAPGMLRISSGGAPQEDGTPADTSGTVVGTQVSWHEAKRNIEPTAVTADDALAAVLAAQIYDFEYAGDDGYQDANGNAAQFTGYVGYDRHEWFLMNVGPQQNPALNAITIPGYYALAFKALQAQIDALTLEVARLSQRPDEP